MRVRVTLPDGTEKRADVRTWQDLHRVVGTENRDGRRVDVVPDGDAFHVIVSAR